MVMQYRKGPEVTRMLVAGLGGWRGGFYRRREMAGKGLVG
jgi:hypothetical protein